MRRRDLGWMLGAMALSWASGVRAQRVYRIGYLSAPNRASVQRTLEMFLRRLQELGWQEGVNFTIDYRWAEGNITLLPELAAQLVEQNVDLIVAPNTAAVVAAKNATDRIPIVTMFVSEPVELKLVSSLRQPGGNVTGTSFTAGPGFGGKLLETLKRALPATVRVGVLSDHTDPGSESQVVSLQTAAVALDVKLEWLELAGADQPDRTLATLASQQLDALLINSASRLMPHRKKVTGVAIECRLPLIASLREFAESGALLSFGVNMSEFVGRSALYVDKILKGARPGDLPVEQPLRYELVVNLHTARALGVTISPALLASADEVIE